MVEVPEAEDREDILDALRALVTARGASDLLHGPVLLPTPTYFPDEWRPDEEGARAMLGRLLAWARLHDQPFDLETWDSSEFRERQLHGSMGLGVHHEGAAAWFAGEQEGQLLFGLDLTQAADAERLAGVLAHEVAHAWRKHHHLVVEDQLLEECLTDLTTVFLGAGVLTTNNTFRYRTSGSYHFTRWSAERLGYLSPAAMAFALAATLRVRDSAREVDAVFEALERTQRPLLRASLEMLPAATVLRERLGIPSVVAPAAPIRFPAPATLRPVELEPVSVSVRHYAWRVRRNRIAQAGFFGFALGCGLAPLLGNAWPLLATFPAAVLGIWWTYDVCSVCACPLRASDVTCVSCHAMLVGHMKGDDRIIDPRHAAVVVALDRARADHQALELEEDSALTEEALSAERRDE